jgi:hypothetical protein
MPTLSWVEQPSKQASNQPNNHPPKQTTTEQNTGGELREAQVDFLRYV